jgi:hypothetical protein
MTSNKRVAQSANMGMALRSAMAWDSQPTEASTPSPDVPTS